MGQRALQMCLTRTMAAARSERSPRTSRLIRREKYRKCTLLWAVRLLDRATPAAPQANRARPWIERRRRRPWPEQRRLTVSGYSAGTGK